MKRPVVISMYLSISEMVGRYFGVQCLDWNVNRSYYVFGVDGYPAANKAIIVTKEIEKCPVDNNQFMHYWSILNDIVRAQIRVECAVSVSCA